MKVSHFDISPDDLPDISDREPTPAQSAPTPAPTANRSPSARSAPAPGRRVMFTQDDDLQLLEFIDECKRQKKTALSGNKIFETLAERVCIVSPPSISPC